MHDRPVVNEEPGQRRRLRQMTAAVVAQIDDEPVDTLVLELADEPLHVLRRAGVVLVAVAERAVIAVETGYLDHADGPVTAVARDRHDLALRRLLFELHLTSGQAEFALTVAG